MEEENVRTGFTIKDLLIRLILIVIFVFLLVWLFPMPDLKPLNNQIFAENMDRMKNVAKTYYTLERLPRDFNTSKKMTLKEMLDKKLILPLMDSNGKYCSEEKSYIEITKKENEYIIKVNLSCTDKEDYIIEHFGCYDICTETCKMLETTNKATTTKKHIPTTKSGKLYEYQFSKVVCDNVFEKYACPTGYSLNGSKCIKNGTKIVSVKAKEEHHTVSKVDKKDAEVVVNSNSVKVDKESHTENRTSTINATPKQDIYDKVFTGYKTVTAQKLLKKETKGAVKRTKTITSGYEKIKDYEYITATKYAKTAWSYKATQTSRKGNLAYENDHEKLVLVDSWEEPACATCFYTVTWYKYWLYEKNTTYSYSCDRFPGYELSGQYCRKPVYKTQCPAGFKDTGHDCVKQEVSYNCDRYGKDYELDSANKTCVKKSYVYKCPEGTENTNDERYCKVKQYGCPSGTDLVNGKCVKTSYTCPTDTSDKNYRLNGTKCIVNEKVKVYSCPSGTSLSSDGKYCIKTNSSTSYTCKNYPGYELSGNKCLKTITTTNTTYKCDRQTDVLNGSVCLRAESVSDIKNATPKYKQVCDKKYKWSTRTSIDGWEYTGNKRQLR